MFCQVQDCLHDNLCLSFSQIVNRNDIRITKSMRNQELFKWTRRKGAKIVGLYVFRHLIPYRTLRVDKNQIKSVWLQECYKVIFLSLNHCLTGGRYFEKSLSGRRIGPTQSDIGKQHQLWKYFSRTAQTSRQTFSNYLQKVMWNVALTQSN